MKIEKLGWYKRRDGKKARVICVDGVCPWPVVAIDEQGIPISYMLNGSERREDQSCNDLISPWPDEPVKGSLEWVGTLPPETIVWNKWMGANESATAGSALPFTSLKDGWHIVGSAEWANALPEGTKVRRESWDTGRFRFRRGDSWFRMDGSESIEPTVGTDWELCREAALRPWKPEEVPVGVRVRAKGGKNWFSIVAAFETGALVVNDSGQNIVSWGNLMRHNEQIDGSPCGVMEDAK